MLKKPILILWLIAISYSTTAQTKYVSTTGNNSNPGTFLLPWRDINYACNNVLSNTEIEIMQGTYYEQVSIGVDSITLKNFSGQNVTIDGSGISSGAIIEISNKLGVTLDSLELQNNIHNDAQGILINGKSSNTTVKHCSIHDIHFSSNPNDPINENTNSQPLIVFGDSLDAISNLSIENNEIYDCRLGFSEALAVNGNVDTFNITGNSVHDVTNIGIVMIGHEQTCSNPALDQARNGVCNSNSTYNCFSPYAANGGIYIDGAKDIVIEQNRCYRNIWGIAVGCEHPAKTSSGIIVRNNIIYHNAKAGIALGGFDFPSGSGKVTDSEIYNNTLYDNDTLNDYEAEINISYAENCTFSNNIVYSKNSDYLMVLQYSSVAPINVVLDSNLYYVDVGITNIEFEWQNVSYTGLLQWQSGIAQDLNTLFGNPDFMDISVFPPDLHLMSSSPAIETAGSSGLSVDKDSIPRPLLSYNDKGAFEFGVFWKGQISNNWHTAGNWSDNAVPTSSDTITIPSPTFYEFSPEIRSNAQVRKLYLSSNSHIEVKYGAAFTLGE